MEAFNIENQDGYSNAEDKPKKAGFFSKEKRAARKEARVQRRVYRKAKRGAKPLRTIIQGGVKKFKNLIHPVKKNADGTGTRPDGSVVPKSDMGSISAPQGLNLGKNITMDFSKSDLQNKAAEVIMDGGMPVVVTTIPEQETVVIDGQVFKTSDTIEVSPTREAVDKKGMSTTTKWIIGGSVGLVVLGIIGFVIYKRRRNSITS